MQNEMKFEATGILICGGQSQRFGRDKRLIEIEGKPLIELSVEKLSVICNEVLITPKKLNEFSLQTYTLIEDYPGLAGPIAGIFNGLKLSRYENLLVLGCDFPLIQVGFLKYLLKAIKENNVKMVVPRLKGVFQPLVAAYKKSIIKLLENRILQNNSFSMQEFIKSYGTEVYIVDKNKYPNLEYELFNLR